MPDSTLSLSEARRIGLAAQGFDCSRPTRPAGVSRLRQVMRRLGLLQIDYVNVLVPAHYFVPFSRLGPYDRNHLDHLVYQRREFIEQWAHEASIVPAEAWPLLHHRREEHRFRPWGFEDFLNDTPGYSDWILNEVRMRGPLCADELRAPDGTMLRIPGTWYRTVPRAALEAHFGRGALAIANRLPNFARSYDLAERVIASEHHGRRIERHDAQRELLRLAGRALGIGSADDLADYYRMPPREARPRLAELVEEGQLREVQVQSWRAPAYLDRSARIPRTMEAASLLSPFDPVVWYRPRAERLFGFEYRIEIYVPAPKRRWGYYVLPFLMGERLVARVDLKADRKTGTLVVPAAYLEPRCETPAVAAALAAELRTVGTWLGLDRVKVAKRGGFARALGAAVRN